MAGCSSMRIVVTGGGTLDRKSNSVGGGFVLDNVDNSVSCGAGGRAIEELNEDKWSAGRYLSVMKWSNTAIYPRPNDAVGCRVHETKDENAKNVKRGRRSHEHGKLSESLPIRHKEMSLHTFKHPRATQEVVEFSGF